MPNFEQLLAHALKGPDRPGLIRTYLDNNTGGHFETYATCRSDPFNITGDDLVAVTMLSMEIKAKTRSGISPASALRIEQRRSTINALLTRLPVHAKLHELTEDEAKALLLAHDSPAWTLWEELLEALKADNTAEKRGSVQVACEEATELTSDARQQRAETSWQSQVLVVVVVVSPAWQPGHRRSPERT
jgi:hypothetical protein